MGQSHSLDAPLTTRPTSQHDTKLVTAADIVGRCTDCTSGWLHSPNDCPSRTPSLKSQDTKQADQASTPTLQPPTMYSVASYYELRPEEAIKADAVDKALIAYRGQIINRPIASWPICQNHRTMIGSMSDEHIKTSLIDNTLINNTALLPVCLSCTFKLFGSHGIQGKRHGQNPEIDMCSCAKKIMRSKCWVCELERLQATWTKAIEERSHSASGNSSTKYLSCACGQASRKTKNNFAEYMRRCEACLGVVTRPYLNMYGGVVVFNDRQVEATAFRTPKWDEPETGRSAVEEQVGPMSERR